ncbi:MAG TPA: hypothetical protein PLA87_13380 [Pseudomonadota bacterium]|nr:hypothetical protein [Pseudomonadota bacterium]
MPTRNPLRLIHAAVEQPFRNYECRYYQECLDQACAGRWESWSCTGCEAFTPAPRAITSNNRGQDFDT